MDLLGFENTRRRIKYETLSVNENLFTKFSEPGDLFKMTFQ